MDQKIKKFDDTEIEKNKHFTNIKTYSDKQHRY